MIRRAFLQGVAALTGLGQDTPSRFPYPGRPQPGQGVGPSAGQVVRARQVIIFGPGGGIWIYSGRPVFGNLIESHTNASGTDPEGNFYIGGDVSYANVGASGYVALQFTAIGLIRYTSPLPGGAAGPYSSGFLIRIDASGILLNAPVIAGGTFTSIAGTAANPTEIITDTWNPLTLINGWTSVISPSYTLFPDRTVMVAGVISSAGAAGNPIFANLPAGPPSYRPATQQETAAGLHGAPPAGGAFMRAAANGDLSILGSTAVTGPWSVNWRFSLDYT
jgi:hypothetical protein